jgi:hypothetical protein
VGSIDVGLLGENDHKFYLATRMSLILNKDGSPKNYNKIFVKTNKKTYIKIPTII